MIARPVDPAADGSPMTAAELFDLLWATLSDLLGSAAAATLLRRGTKSLLVHRPELDGLLITRDGLEYRYVTPDSWRVFSEETLSALRDLARELSPILLDLTGVVVAHRLDNIDQFRRNDIRFAPGRPQ